MTILYQADSTHELSLIHVELDSRVFGDGTPKYRDGFTGFRAIKDAEWIKLRGIDAWKVLGVEGYLFDSTKCLANMCGAVRELSDAEVEALTKANDGARVARQAKAAATPAPSLIAQGLACYSCGRPRKVRNGECVYCGADA